MAGLFGRKSFTLDFKHRALHFLKANHGNISKTARELNISRQNLQQWHNDASTINKAVKRNDIKSGTTRRVRKHVGQYPLLDTEVLKYVIEKNRKGHRVIYQLFCLHVDSLLPKYRTFRNCLFIKSYWTFYLSVKNDSQMA